MGKSNKIMVSWKCFKCNKIVLVPVDSKYIIEHLIANHPDWEAKTPPVPEKG